MSEVRLNKAMAERGLCSRREADDLISQGLVMVNGKPATLGLKITAQDKVEILKKGLKTLEAKVTFVLNKPVGYVSSQPEKGYSAAVELITAQNKDPFEKVHFSRGHLRGLAPAGRLDIDSQGLLILTQDGVLAKKIIGPESEVEKEYLVRVKGRLSERDLERLQNGSLVLDGRKLKPAHIEWINDDQLRFVLTEGLKRQIRRMCEAVNLQVVGLKRVRIGNLKLGPLKEGQWRYLKSIDEI